MGQSDTRILDHPLLLYSIKCLRSGSYKFRSTTVILIDYKYLWYRHVTRNDVGRRTDWGWGPDYILSEERR